ncbi:ribokinase [Asticcacaulis sp. EMRT-3]|uniref:ribokinase n=1 Tax=Asticcacaulis sp. EMRT-3 TaxID=3040349 RepID=UPI0024AFC4D2|nr:ribokinase [Asticcacaulis sp. EMRT-3]MDI7773898.1 ribokinase [Asticcacaulis sp. EMRT-3]
MRKKLRIVVAGSVNADFILRVAALPQANETIMATDSALVIGGKGLNQAVAIARQGHAAHMIAVIGDDDLGRQARDFLKSMGVDDSHVRSETGTGTGIANILVAASGDNMIVVSPGANACLTPEDIDVAGALIRGADAFVVQLETPEATVRKGLQSARAAGVLTVLNPAPAQVWATDLLPLADVVTPNEIELAALTGITGTDNMSLSAALTRLHDMGATTPVVTLGVHGSATLMDGTLIRVPTFRVEAVDATGAGDIFNGTLVGELATGCPVPAAMRRASAAAAISVSRRSANAAPSTDEVTDFLRALG